MGIRSLAVVGSRESVRCKKNVLPPLEEGGMAFAHGRQYRLVWSALPPPKQKRHNLQSYIKCQKVTKSETESVDSPSYTVPGTGTAVPCDV